MEITGAFKGYKWLLNAGQHCFKQPLYLAAICNKFRNKIKNKIGFNENKLLTLNSVSAYFLLFPWNATQAATRKPWSFYTTDVCLNLRIPSTRGSLPSYPGNSHCITAGHGLDPLNCVYTATQVPLSRDQVQLLLYTVYVHNTT